MLSPKTTSFGTALETIHGRPDICASKATIPSPSALDGKRNTSIAAYIAAGDVVSP